MQTQLIKITSYVTKSLLLNNTKDCETCLKPRSDNTCKACKGLVTCPVNKHHAVTTNMHGDFVCTVCKKVIGGQYEKC
jgi:hypothetical protein